MKVFVINREGKKELTKWKSWQEMIEAGYILTEIRANRAVMVHNGYINQYVNEVQ